MATLFDISRCKVKAIDSMAGGASRGTLRSFLLLISLMIGSEQKGVASDLHSRHNYFENSAADRAFYHSEADRTAPSALEIVDGKIPVEAGSGTSPPNCLRLAWTSAQGGDWHARIKATTRYGQRFELEGDVLVFWCYSEEGLEPIDAPRIVVSSAEGSLPAIPLLEYHGPLTAGRWERVAIPFEKFTGLFRGTDDSKFEPAKLDSILFVQGLDDGRPNVLLIDDVRVVHHQQLEDGTPPPMPTGLTVAGHDRHFDLVWETGPGADVMSYRIYRSWEGQSYEPVATRPASYSRAVDFVGASDKRAYYKVSAIDTSNNESALTEPVQAATRGYNDDELLSMVQQACFRYYWEASHPGSGMALEILPGDRNLVALGASGFGVMALIVGAEREFVPREQIAGRILKIVRFLESADRFHGAWPHFFHGDTGRVYPFFGKYDNGADLVETAFMVQALLTARQYFDRDTAAERETRATVTRLWREVEWDWFRQTPESEVLYWHWSPDYTWHISHPLIGWNETMIVYLLAIASPTHAVPASLYHTGFAGQSEMAVEYRRNWSRTTEGDHFVNGSKYYGVQIDVGCGNGGELFFNEFSFLGFDPRGKRDRYANYFHNSRNIALVNRAYAIDNPLNRVGYGPDCWGRSAGINSGGGRALPRDDNGTISCSAALGVFPFTPDESLAALKHFYRNLGDKVWGVYGFHDGFNETENWFDEVYMGLNQAQIVAMIENHRSGLLWKHFMANPEISPMLRDVGFVSEESRGR